MKDSEKYRGDVARVMRDAREAAGMSLTDACARLGDYSKGFVSEVERDHKLAPPPLVYGYDELFDLNGYLIGLLHDYQSSMGRERRRDASGKSTVERGAVPGDESTFVDETPDDIELFVGESAVKSWTLLNSGTVAWEGRKLERTGRVRGIDVPVSERTVPIASTAPGGTVMIEVRLKCASEPGTRGLRFKMVTADGHRCFPEEDFGLTVEVTSRAKRRG